MNDSSPQPNINPNNPNPYNPSYNQPSSDLPSNHKGLWIFGIIFVIIVLGVISYFLFFQSPVTNNSQNNIVTLPPNNTQGVLETVYCTNWDCFINAANTCAKANFTNTLSLEIFGMNTTTTTYYEISRNQTNLCNLKLKTLDEHINFTDNLTQQMLAGGATQDEINQQQQQSNDQLRPLIGREGICQFKPTKLNNLLMNWRDGNFSGGVSCSLNLDNSSNCTYSGDWQLAENCSGQYFNTSL